MISWSCVKQPPSIRPFLQGNIIVNQFLFDAIDIFLSEMRSLILPAIRKVYGADSDGIMEKDVSFDGTRVTRGHKSHANVGLVIEYETGLPLQLEVISNFCMVWTKQQNKLSDAEFAIWYEMHKDDCHLNLKGKSRSMAAKPSLTKCSRSQTLEYRYRTFISDGDTQIFKTLWNLNAGKRPCPGVLTTKEECINHVSKYLRNRIRKLKESMKRTDHHECRKENS